MVEEHSSLLLEDAAPAPAGVSRRLRNAAALAGSFGLFGLVAGIARRGSAGGGAPGATAALDYVAKAAIASREGASHAAPINAEAYALRVSNAYERRLNPIGDGWYPFEHLVECHQPTRLELALAGADGAAAASADVVASLALAADEEFAWLATGLLSDASDASDAIALDAGARVFFDAAEGFAARSADDDAAAWAAVASLAATTAGATLEATFTRIGAHSVRSIRKRTRAIASFNVTCKYVRRELRDLTDADRDHYFEALRTVYTTEQQEGVKIYGEHFKSAAWLVREHLYGAADKSCDHWHDDAGFLNHHVGITLQLEASMRSVDPRVCSHYWDYTVDAAAESVGGKDYVTSVLFDADWFGSANPNRTDHAISHGRWAFTKVMSDATAFSNITNPYGLLRSPWNTDPTPYVTRSRYVLGVKDAYYTLPQCSAFQTYLKADDDTGSVSIAEIMNALNGELHGPVHIMTGGHWWISDSVNGAASKFAHAGYEYSPDQVLLGSKFLWRQGYVRCPESCSADTPQSECVCSCPSEIIDGRTSEQVLEDSGVSSIYSLMDQQFIEGVGLTYDEMLALLCHVGHAGDMFTSAAPQDPLFWPLHGLAERFVQLARLMGDRGLLTLDETWGYKHQANILSDTHVVCDWSEIPDRSMAMPHCTKGATCSGHKADDVLPFEQVLGKAGRPYYTNEQFYEAIAPSSGDLPYVYDKLTTWPGCEGGTILDMASSSSVPSVR